MAKIPDDPCPLPGINPRHFALKFEAAFRRFGLFALLMIIAAALAGVFSGGYFSNAQIASADNHLQIHYQRFNRLQNDVPLIITARDLPPGRLIFSLGHQFMSAFKPETVFPQPDQMYSQGQTLYLVYNAIPSRGDFSVWIVTSPEQPGKTITSVSINALPGLRFWQFVYP